MAANIQDGRVYHCKPNGRSQPCHVVVLVAKYSKSGSARSLVAVAEVKNVAKIEPKLDEIYSVETKDLQELIEPLTKETLTRCRDEIIRRIKSAPPPKN